MSKGNPLPPNAFDSETGKEAGKLRAWKPGEYGGYSQWLAALTPEELAAHKLKRQVKANMRKAMKNAQESMQEAWISALDHAAAKVLQRAIDNGDPQALQVVWDRVVGKPSTEIEMSVENRQQTLADIMMRVKQIGDENGDNPN
jgi:hypothetical protein